MSITSLTPSDVSPELRMRIEKIMRRQNMTWREAVIFLARKVVSPEAGK